MNSFRNPKYVERYEDVVFELETALHTTPANGVHQKKIGYRFVVNNSGEVTPFDWYNARISLDFKVTLLAGGNIAVDDHNGIVNSSSSFIKHLNVKANGKEVYDCNNANHCVNIKNLLEYSPAYAATTATNELFYLDTNRHAEERGDEDNYNRGFSARKTILGISSTVSADIPLNRYSFFENLDNELLPNTRIELNFEIESDGNLIWQAGAVCRVIITRMLLYIPRITFNSEGQSLYISRYLKPHKWTYLRENIERSNSSQQRVGTFKISSGISKPRHVFIFIINDPDLERQTSNSFLYNTFHISTNPCTISTCYLEVGGGNEYPEIHYTPNTDMPRVFRDVLKYVHANNEYQEGTLLNRNNFDTIFPFLYFDLTNQKTDIKDGTTKLAFKYTLNATTAAMYSVYALTLYEQDIELQQKDGKLFLRS